MSMDTEQANELRKAQRIAIAKYRANRDGFYTLHSGSHVHEVPIKFLESGGEIFPDYLKDLNAMHEAVLTLKDKDKAALTFHLLEILGIRDDQSPEPSEMFDFANATAAQRAEAFFENRRQVEGINVHKTDSIRGTICS